MTYQTNQRKVTIMAHQAGKRPKSTGAPGPTPAPVRYANPSMDEKVFTPGYGTNHFTGRSSVDPGQKSTSKLADNLKSKAAEGDAGDLLQSIIEGGTARGRASRVELQAPQTREVDASPIATSFGMRSRNNEGDKVPATTGAPVSQPVRKP